jgi:hypothetical protein
MAKYTKNTSTNHQVHGICRNKQENNDCGLIFGIEVVILGVRRLLGRPNERAGGRSCPLRPVRTRHIRHILLIFSKNTSNILEYA